MERTIPIFRALIASDIEKKYHTSHEELGIALLGMAFKDKDKNKPDPIYLDEACKELSEAIKMRGEWKPEYGTYWLSYEFYDAICKISSDEEFQKGKPTTKPEVKEAILKDINAAAKDPKLSDRMREQATKIPEWMKINGLNIDEYVHPK